MSVKLFDERFMTSKCFSRPITITGIYNAKKKRKKSAKAWWSEFWYSPEKWVCNSTSQRQPVQVHRKCFFSYRIMIWSPLRKHIRVTVPRYICGGGYSGPIRRPVVRGLSRRIELTQLTLVRPGLLALGRSLAGVTEIARISLSYTFMHRLVRSNSFTIPNKFGRNVLYFVATNNKT